MSYPKSQNDYYDQMARQLIYTYRDILMLKDSENSTEKLNNLILDHEAWIYVAKGHARSILDFKKNRDLEKVKMTFLTSELSSKTKECEQIKDTLDERTKEYKIANEVLAQENKTLKLQIEQLIEEVDRPSCCYRALQTMGVLVILLFIFMAMYLIALEIPLEREPVLKEISELSNFVHEKVYDYFDMEFSETPTCNSSETIQRSPIIVEKVKEVDCSSKIEALNSQSIGLLKETQAEYEKKLIAASSNCGVEKFDLEKYYIEKINSIEKSCSLCYQSVEKSRVEFQAKIQEMESSSSSMKWTTIVCSALILVGIALQLSSSRK
jgi:hypothetical protein